jgi:hypothetical protein
MNTTPAIGMTLKYNAGACHAIGSDIVADTAITTAMNNTIGAFSGGIADHTIINAELSSAVLSNIYDLSYLYDLPIQWAVKTTPRNFVENVRSLYKFKLPGSKSQFFNIIIRNSKISIADRLAYETVIRETAKQNSPDYTMLKEIIWK